MKFDKSIIVCERCGEVHIVREGVLGCDCTEAPEEVAMIHTMLPEGWEADGRLSV